MIIERKNMYNMSDCYKFKYLFKLQNATIEFFQGSNQDLIFAARSQDKKIIMEINNTELNINKEEYLLYNSIYKLYNEIVINICMSKHNYECKKNGKPEYFYTPYGYFDLVNDEIINWKSDAPAYEDGTESGERIYNYLNIFKDKYIDKYIIEFINNTSKQFFCIEFNTSRSRYGRFVYPFCQLIRDLEEITNSNRLVDTNKTLTKRK